MTLQESQCGLIRDSDREPRLPNSSSGAGQRSGWLPGEQWLDCSQADLPGPNGDSKTNKHEFLFLLPWGGNCLRLWGIQFITLSL